MANGKTRMTLRTWLASARARGIGTEIYLFRACALQRDFYRILRMDAHEASALDAVGAEHLQLLWRIAPGILVSE